MKTALRFTMAALAGLVFSAAHAGERGSPGAVGSARGEACGPLAYNPPEDRAGREERTGKGGEAAVRYEDEDREEAEGGPGSAGREPGREEREAGIGSSVHVDPGYHVQDPSESQFLLETWTAGG
jgi:hypothetical protein